MQKSSRKNRLVLLILGVLIVGAGAYFTLRGSSEESVNTEVQSSENLSASKVVNAPAQSANGDAWQVRCANDDTKPKRGRCEAVQVQTMTDSGQRLIEFAIGFPEGSSDARGVLVLPLGIMLQPGGTIKVDEEKPLNFGIRYCMPNGCYAYLSLNEDIQNIMAKGANALLTIQANNGKNININMPLSSFSKALKDVRDH